MPTLKQLTCTVERGNTKKSFNEYGTAYGDGYVETYIPLSFSDTSFAIHLVSKGYIAPGLAMFVYIDGIYQCNRNRYNLKLPEKKAQISKSEIDFRVRQKEERVGVGDGDYIGREWRFHHLQIVSGIPEAQMLAQMPAMKRYFAHLGSIQVVVLRCIPASASAASFAESTDDSDCDPSTEPPRKSPENRSTAQQVENVEPGPDEAAAEVRDFAGNDNDGFGGLFDGPADEFHRFGGDGPAPGRGPPPNSGQQFGWHYTSGNGGVYGPLNGNQSIGHPNWGGQGPQCHNMRSSPPQDYGTGQQGQNMQGYRQQNWQRPGQPQTGGYGGTYGPPRPQSRHVSNTSGNFGPGHGGHPTSPVSSVHNGRPPNAQWGRKPSSATAPFNNGPPPNVGWSGSQHGGSQPGNQPATPAVVIQVNQPPSWPNRVLDASNQGWQCQPPHGGNDFFDNQNGDWNDNGGHGGNARNHQPISYQGHHSSGDGMNNYNQYPPNGNCHGGPWASNTTNQGYNGNQNSGGSNYGNRGYSGNWDPDNWQNNNGNQGYNGNSGGYGNTPNQGFLGSNPNSGGAWNESNNDQVYHDNGDPSNGNNQSGGNDWSNQPSGGYNDYNNSDNSRNGWNNNQSGANPGPDNDQPWGGDGWGNNQSGGNDGNNGDWGNNNGNNDQSGGNDWVNNDDKTKSEMNGAWGGGQPENLHNSPVQQQNNESWNTYQPPSQTQQFSDQGFGQPSEPQMALFNSPGARSAGNDEPALYRVPEDIARETNTTHQMQPGRPFPYSHRIKKPVYLDSLDEPYAMFVFKYRAKEFVETLLGITIEPEPEPELDIEEKKRQLLDMSKEELIEQLLRAQNLSNGNEANWNSSLGNEAGYSGNLPNIEVPDNTFLNYATNAPVQTQENNGNWNSTAWNDQGNVAAPSQHVSPLQGAPGSGGLGIRGHPAMDAFSSQLTDRLHNVQASPANNGWNGGGGNQGQNTSNDNWSNNNTTGGEQQQADWKSPNANSGQTEPPPPGGGW